MNFTKLCEKRSSIRSFTEQKISKVLIDQILEVGRLAPSGRNSQSWNFIVIQNKELKEKYNEVCYNQPCVKQSDLLILFESQIDSLMTCDVDAGTVDCTIAATQMMLKITELGLGSVMLGHFDQESSKKLVNATGKIITILAVGYPADNGRPKSRKSLEEVSTYYL